LAHLLFKHHAEIKKNERRFKMTLVTYNPRKTYGHVARDFDSLFNSFFKGVGVDGHYITPRADVVEYDDKLTLMAEIPGMEKGEIKVLVEDGTLTISGEKKPLVDEKNVNYIRAELNTGSFSRSFTLPDYVDMQKIKADYENGVLVVTLPKTEQVKPKEIEVKVS
jgi:HSP20 family protein